jgi:WD40 repeat protein
VAAAVPLDGRLLVAAATEAGEIVLHDVGAGTAVGSPLRGHEARISTLAVVPVGDRPVLVSTSLDNSVRVWDVAVHAHG